MSKIVIATTEDLKLFNTTLKLSSVEKCCKTKVRIPRKENILIDSISSLANSRYLSSPDMRIFFAYSEGIANEPYHTVNVITLKREIEYPIYYDHSHQMIRAVVAQKGHKLDVLINDHSPIVRMEVAKHWYGLERLMKDSDDNVKAEALVQLNIIEELRNITNARHNVKF
ncbi:MAG: hypothetical protein [Podoviridae sp. ctLUJ1]|nr:MAG: hypothetical protein [Podoviridae sp. ctLUJ1]